MATSGSATDSFRTAGERRQSRPCVGNKNVRQAYISLSAWAGLAGVTSILVHLFPDIAPFLHGYTVISTHFFKRTCEIFARRLLSVWHDAILHVKRS